MAEREPVEIDAAELTDVFAAPSWLRDIGFTAWLLVGVTLFLVGAIWVLSLTHTIVTPVLTAAVIPLGKHLSKSSTEAALYPVAPRWLPDARHSRHPPAASSARE